MKHRAPDLSALLDQFAEATRAEIAAQARAKELEAELAQARKDEEDARTLAATLRKQLAQTGRRPRVARPEERTAVESPAHARPATSEPGQPAVSSPAPRVADQPFHPAAVLYFIQHEGRADGVPAATLADAMNISNAKGLGPVMAFVRRRVKEVGFEPEEVVRNERRRKKPYWIAGPRCLDAIQALGLPLRDKDTASPAGRR